MWLTRSNQEVAHSVCASEIDYYLQHRYGVRLHKLQIEHYGRSWRLRIKVSKRRERLIAYLRAKTYSEVVRLAGEMAKSGGLTWFPDRFP